MRRTCTALVLLAALAAPATASAALEGTTSQRHEAQRGKVRATVADDRRSLPSLVIDAVLTCDATAGTTDVRTFTITDVNVSGRGAFDTEGAFEQAATSADGQAVVGSFTTRLRGRLRDGRLKGTLTAKVSWTAAGAVYATCASGRVTFRAR